MHEVVGFVRNNHTSVRSCHGNNQNNNRSVASVIARPVLFTPAAKTAIIKLTCSAKDTIGNVLRKLTLLESGACNENLRIPEDIIRLVVVIDGQAITISGTNRGFKPE
jgi:hypothetical protein